ncbi:23S rRNA (uracil(747)-C(5))-methyltransferase [Micrococcus sp. HMSC067E09]|uniref:methyltransferase domain-containing protein n=1 Tax=Micrococcus sp. HMSC067E09 TaxID=1739367 RepID=UPI0008A49422|nr:methyltransferase domain-containing protein [Micrococcus sp. HMSC067E09]OFR89770.1 23S rRNA (uracil(747)-C(5))-methyltransferase [Micrococcus sp. HMSC067E09]
MQCPHFDAGRCRSCALMGVPYADQLTRADAEVRGLLSAHLRQAETVGGGALPATRWEAPFASAESGFRNKAKLVVTGTSARPRLGILDPGQHPRHHDGTGHDLRDCGLYAPGMQTVFDAVARSISRAGLTPYHVGARTGELKNVIVTLSPDAECMVRFVLRSTAELEALRAEVPTMRGELAAAGVPAVVVTANLLPAHVALPEGEEEIPLAGDRTLTMRLNGIGLRLRPQGFFQTNTAVASALYADAAQWVDEASSGEHGVAVRRVWDLYCGVGGFAFHLASEDREVWGQEVSAEAVAAAQETAAALGLAHRVTFDVGDATAALSFGKPSSPDTLSFGKESGSGALSFGKESSPDTLSRTTPQTAPDEAPDPRRGDGHAQAPDVVVVNPPRRGIGAELSEALEASGVRLVLYSSCNAKTLAQDLARMPSYRLERARVFDMFPQTAHAETLVLLRRR